MDVISHADFILSLLENYSSEEMPPEWMWAFPEPMSRHLKEMSEKRKAKYSGSEESNMSRNELLD